MRKLLVLGWLFSVFFCAQGQFDDQMKAQRRAFFAAMPINSNDIVFIGNSITNGGEWQEFFPELSIKDRGISGDKSSDVLTRLHPIVIGQPKKVFIKVGTNDGPSEANNQAIANRIGQIIDTFKLKSPSTEIFVETILPRGGNNSIRDLNEKIASICNNKSVSFLNVYSILKNADSTNLNSNYSNDNLHLLGTGYSKWAKFLLPYVGTEELGINEAETVSLIGGLNHGYCNQRATQFELLKGSDNDVLFIGDDVIDCVEWSEMFQNKNVKGRGTGVTVSTSLWIDQLVSVVKDKIFRPYTTTKPTKIFIYAGANDIIKNGKDANFVKTHIKTIVDYIRQQSPTTQIFIQGYLPHSIETESAKLITANTALKTLAESYTDGVTYIDLFAAFKKATTNTITAKYTISANALNAKGFLHWANTVYTYIDSSIKPVEEPEDLTTTMPTNGPKVSDEMQSHWYYIKGQRGTGGENYVTANLDNSVVQKPYNQTGYQHWRIVNNEGGFILQNRITQKYINSAGNGELSLLEIMPDKALQFRPSQDPAITESERSNYFCLENISATQTSASFRLHAGGSGNSFKLMNWTGGANDNSSWKFVTANENDSQTPIEEVNPLPTPLVQIDEITLDGVNPYRLPQEEFNKIKDLESGTIVITLRTASSDPSGNQYIFAAADTTTTYNYAGVALNNTAVRIQIAPINSIEAWYTGAGTAPSFASDLKIVYRATKANLTLDMNVNQNYTKSITVGSGTNPSYRFIKNFDTASPTNAFYLGGIVTSNNKNKHPLTGTIKNLTIYSTALTNEQVSYLHNHWDKVTTEVPTTKVAEQLKVIQSEGNLSIILPNGHQAAKAMLYNMYGQIAVSNDQPQASTCNLIVNACPKGIYLVKVITKEGRQFSQTIVKR